MSAGGYMLSECCGARVVVLVDIGARLYVRENGDISTTLADSLRHLRAEAIEGLADRASAYCVECGGLVDLPEDEA